MKSYPKTLSMDTAEPNDEKQVRFQYTNDAYIRDEDEKPIKYPMTVGDIEPYHDAKKHDHQNSMMEDGALYHRKRRKSSLPQSTWWMWTQKRRSETFQSGDMLNGDSKQHINSSTKTPEHILKAWEESMGFMTPEVQKRFWGNSGAANNIDKYGRNYKKKPKNSIVTKIPLEDWKQLILYWDLRYFVICRILGFCAGMISLIPILFILFDNVWIFYSKNNQSFYAGIWNSCKSNGTNVECVKLINGLATDPLTTEFLIQTVDGFIITGLAFACVANIFSIRSVQKMNLAKKIYLCHSSGEIFFVSGCSTLIGTTIYPKAISQHYKLDSFTYARSYFLSWGGIILMFITALLLLIDDIIREFFRPRTCPKRLRRFWNKFF